MQFRLTVRVPHESCFQCITGKLCGVHHESCFRCISGTLCGYIMTAPELMYPAPHLDSTGIIGSAKRRSAYQVAVVCKTQGADGPARARRRALAQAPTARSVPPGWAPRACAARSWAAGAACAGRRLGSRPSGGPHVSLYTCILRLTLITLTATAKGRQADS